MMKSALSKFEGMQNDVMLAKYSTFGMGGPADWFFDLRDFALLPALIDCCCKEGLPFLILGWGSNVIFSDKGFRGLVIKLAAKSIKMDGDLVCADAGALLSQVINFALDNGFVGMEKLMGVPGTVGGAVRGNAGAYGVEIKDFFVKATMFDVAKEPFARMSVVQETVAGGFNGLPSNAHDPSTKSVAVPSLEVRNFEDMKFAYRTSVIKTDGGIIEKVWLKLPKGDAEMSRNEIREIVSSRAGKHPQGYSCGSFFKNPSRNSQGSGLSAGMAIEEAGMKGARVGGAFVSEKHANFLMSDGTATLEDLRALVQQIQAAVMTRFAILLEPEVQVVDESGEAVEW